MIDLDILCACIRLHRKIDRSILVKEWIEWLRVDKIKLKYIRLFMNMMSILGTLNWIIYFIISILVNKIKKLHCF